MVVCHGIIVRSFGQQSSATSALSAPTATCRFLRRLLLESSLEASSKGLSRGSGIVYRVSGFLVKKGSEDYWVWEVQLAPTKPRSKSDPGSESGFTWRFMGCYKRVTSPLI